MQEIEQKVQKKKGVGESISLMADGVFAIIKQLLTKNKRPSLYRWINGYFLRLKSDESLLSLFQS
jgi:hypothetical protein